MANPTLSQIKVGQTTYDICDTTARDSISQINDVISSGILPTVTYTGSSNTVTDSASGWRITWFNVVLTTIGNPNEYFTNNNGVITALKNCALLISGTMRWQDSVAGQRGIGLFTDVNGGHTGGTEAASSFSYFSYTNSANCVVYLPPRLFTLSTGDHITVRRYTQANAVYTNGPNFSWLTICVVGKNNN